MQHPSIRRDNAIDRRYAAWGAVYFASGTEFVREAEQAAASVRKQMPDLPLCLFADEKAKPGVFDIERPLGPGLKMKQQKMFVLRHSPFEKTCFLDTDIHLCAPIYECFDLIDDGYEMAAALSPWWSPGSADDDPAAEAQPRGRRERGVPTAFPKINSGVMLMAKTPNVMNLLEQWQVLHAADGGSGQDQDPLRVALYESRVRWAPLPPHYNFRLLYPGVVNGEIKILHGRHPSLPLLADRLNEYHGVRGIIPVRGYQRVLYFGWHNVGSRLMDRAVKMVSYMLR